MNFVNAIVLAAGQGTRMKSNLHKVLHPVGGKAMVEHVLDTLEQVGVDKTYLVIGHGAEKVKESIGNRVTYCLQEEQLGTGHAVMQVESSLANKDGITFVFYGDTPLLKIETISSMLLFHKENHAAVTLLSTIEADPTGYGRIIRDSDGTVLRIVEQKDANEEEKQVQEINAGTYCFDNRKLFTALTKITNKNAQGEYYLTDVIAVLRNEGNNVYAYLTTDAEETIGINDRVQLSRAETILKRRINERHMRNGVTIQDPEHTYIEGKVTIGSDTIILSGSHIKGNTSIGEGCVIGPDADITSCRIGDGVSVHRSVMLDSKVDANATIGPFAYIRPNSSIGKEVKIGDFVEIKNASIGDGTKVSHLSYIGDAELGKGVNMGCGSITVNYDGIHKHKTIVQDGAFVGCNVNLIAPVQVGESSYVAAGSTINRDVPAGALAIGREKQVNKENYADKIKARRKPSK